MTSNSVCSAELFSYATEEEAEQACEKNPLIMERATYFSERYRVAKVNIQVITSAKKGEVVEFSFFDDVRLFLIHGELKEHSVPSVWEWSGEVIDPKVYQASMIDRNKNFVEDFPLTGEQFADVFFTQKLRLTSWDVNNKTGKKTMAKSRASKLNMVDEIESAVPKDELPHHEDYSFNAFTTMNGGVSSKRYLGPVMYGITEMPETPNFVILTESDPEKTLYLEPNSPTDKSPEAEMARKIHAEYQAFSRALLKYEYEPIKCKGRINGVRLD